MSPRDASERLRRRETVPRESESSTGRMGPEGAARRVCVRLGSVSKESQPGIRVDSRKRGARLCITLFRLPWHTVFLCPLPRALVIDFTRRVIRILYADTSQPASALPPSPLINLSDDSAGLILSADRYLR